MDHSHFTEAIGSIMKMQKYEFVKCISQSWGLTSGLIGKGKVGSLHLNCTWSHCSTPLQWPFLSLWRKVTQCSVTQGQWYWLPHLPSLGTHLLSNLNGKMNSCVLSTWAWIRLWACGFVYRHFNHHTLNAWELHESRIRN